jgi:hypothetical protein
MAALFSDRGRSRVALALFALGAVACPGRTSTQSMSTTFPMQPVAGVTFTGRTDATFSHPLPENAHARLSSVTLTTDVSDFSWLARIEATSTPHGGEPTLLFRKEGFPPGSSSVDLEVEYDGDVRPFFIDGTSVHLDWSGAYAPTVHPYPNVVHVDATFTLDVE